MKTLLTRTLTGLLFIAVVIASVLISPTILLNVFLIFTCIGLVEYRLMVSENGVALSTMFYVLALSTYFLLSVGLLLWPFSVVVTATLCLCVMFFLSALFRKDDEVFRYVGYAVSGVIWIAVPMALINIFPRLSVGDAGKWLLLAFFVLVWANDTLAYCVGSLMGRHPFFPRISPKKTWEGTLGGAILTVLLSLLFPHLFPMLALHTAQWVGFACVICVFGTLGDLVESMLKRQASVKDSGNLLPGHGGILDRFDSTLMAIPWVLLYLQIAL